MKLTNHRITNQGNDKMDKKLDVLDIGIDALNRIKNMCCILEVAEKKEDFVFILQTMQTELDTALEEIEQMSDESGDVCRFRDKNTICRNVNWTRRTGENLIQNHICMHGEQTRCTITGK